jgi:hypothetical protein
LNDRIPEFAFPFPLLWYIKPMFRITKHAEGDHGAFVKLIQLAGDDFAVVVRAPMDGRLHHRYIGPDPSKAEEVFTTEVAKLPVAPGR